MLKALDLVQKRLMEFQVEKLSVASAGATTATDNFRIIGFKDVADIDYAAAGVVALVKLNLPIPPRNNWSIRSN